MSPPFKALDESTQGAPKLREGAFVDFVFGPMVCRRGIERFDGGAR